jgi:energy-coupling factor transport system permease protein
VHQGAWLLWALCGGLVAITTTNPFYLVPLLAVAWVVHAACARPGPQSRSFRIFLIFGVLTICTRTALVLFLPDIQLGNVVEAGVEGLRLAVLLTIFGTFNTVSDPFGVLRLSPRRFHEPALAASLALSMAPRTIAAVGIVREAQRMRGIEIRRLRSLPALAVPVLETSMEEAVTLAESMDARGHGRGPRTRYRPERWGLQATVVSLVSVIAAVLSGGALLGDDPSLAMSTFPITWPEVSPVLLAGVLALSLPAWLPRSESTRAAR